MNYRYVKPAITLIPIFTCSVGFYQMAKIAVTPTIVFAEFVLYKKTISFKKVRLLKKIGSCNGKFFASSL